MSDPVDAWALPDNKLGKYHYQHTCDKNIIFVVTGKKAELAKKGVRGIYSQPKCVACNRFISIVDIHKHRYCGGR